jgi:hypothetical protein
VTISEILTTLVPYFDADGGSVSEISYLTAIEAPSKASIRIANGEFRADTPEFWTLGLGNHPLQQSIAIAVLHVSDEQPDRVERIEISSTVQYEYARPLVRAITENEQLMELWRKR